MGDKGDPYHFYGFQTSFGAPVFNTNADGEYTSELAMGGSGGTDFANWLKAQGDAGVISPSITGDIAKQASATSPVDAGSKFDAVALRTQVAF